MEKFLINRKKLIISSVLIFTFSYKICTSSTIIDPSLTKKVNTLTNQFDYEQFNLDQEINKLFRCNQLPQNNQESILASESYYKALTMLKAGNEIKALPYLFLAEKYLIPESIIVLIDISENKYQNIPVEIAMKIQKQLPIGIEKKDLILSYKHAFSANEKLLTFSKSSILTKISNVFRQNVTSIKINKLSSHNEIKSISYLDKKHEESIAYYQIPLLKSDDLYLNKKIE